MDHTKRILKSGSQLFGSQIVVNLFVLMFGAFFAHKLPKEEMAIFAVTNLLTGLITVLGGLGLSMTVYKMAPELITKNEKERAASLIKFNIFFNFMTSFILILLLILFLKMLSFIFLKGEELGNYNLIIIPLVFFENISSTFDTTLRSLQRFSTIAIIKIIKDVVSRIISLLLFFILGFKGFLLGFIIGSFFSTVLSVYYISDFLFLKSSVRFHWELIIYSLPFYVSGILRYILINIDQYMIGIFLEPEILATYFITKKLASYLNMSIDSLMEPITPKLAEFKADSISKIKNVFPKTVRFNAYTFTPLSFGFAALSYPIILLYGGEKYTNGASILAILSLSMIPYSYLSLVLINTYVIGKPIEWLKINMVGGFANLILGILMINIFKADGIACSKFAALLISVIYGYTLLKKLIPISFELKTVYKITFSSLVLFFFLLILQIIYFKITIIPFYIIACSLLYMLATRKMIYNDDISLIYHIFPKKFIPVLNVLFVSK
ncbi:MAG: oligosaccharide flippase family protein [Candidatus Hodarchaeota archaeon]